MTGPVQLLRDVLVPEALVRHSRRFGGTREDDCRRGDLVVKGGRVVQLQAAEPSAAPRMVLPWLVEAHCHLDKCHTAPRLRFQGGDLAAAIAAQMADKVNWSDDDLRRRMGTGLAELRSAGCRLVRSHVDWGDTSAPPRAWALMGEMAEQAEMALDRAALVNLAQLVREGAQIARHLSASGGALGSFVHGQPEQRAGIKAAFRLAERYGLALDFHVDEGLASGLNGLEMIADEALDTEFAGPILCGHACSLMNLESDDLLRLLDKLAAAGIAVAALPTTNLYLQGRVDGTPDRRGLTRLKELDAAGVKIVVGSDNVSDAFCPTGRHDPLAALDLAVLAAHLDPPLGRWLPLVTTNAARALGRDPVYVDGAALEDLCLCDAAHAGDLIAGRGGALRPVALVAA